MYNWFRDNYIKVEEPTPYDFIQIKDIYNEWKNSDFAKIALPPQREHDFQGFAP